MILKSSKISVFYDGKRVKLEGSNLLKNKLCGLCGDNNNNKIADVPSPRKCLLSKPKFELASYRVSLPSKPCRPLPSHLKEELESLTPIIPKTDDCVTLKHDFFKTEPAYPYWIGYYCFSRLPNVVCQPGCQLVGMRWEKVEFVW